MRRLLMVFSLLLMAESALARTVTDMAGREVQVPDTVHRVACLEVLCYPRMFMLGAVKQVATMYDTAAPWMRATNPAVETIPKFTGDPNPEDLLARGVDVAFYRYTPDRTLAQLTELGIPAVLSQPARSAATIEEFADDTKRMVRLFGQVLGGEAEKQAEDWCIYFDARRRFVAGRVAQIPPEKRVRAYYVRGPEALSTQGRDGYTTWTGEMAGANMVVRASPLSGKGAVSMEDVVRWDPQVILVGRQYPLSLVQADPRWKDVSAVRRGRVHPTPEGVFYWDGGPESVLLMQFMAKLLYPELFQDFDMEAEVKSYYARFYNATLSDADVRLLLQGRSPDGSRFNPQNN